MAKTSTLEGLTERSQFLAAARGRRYATKSLVLQAKRRPEPQSSPHIGYGITATRKIGNAVVRNRTKRRLREAARQILPVAGRPGFDYVLIGRATTISCPWQSLLDDLTLALQMVHQPRASRRPSSGAPRRAAAKPPQSGSGGPTTNV